MPNTNSSSCSIRRPRTSAARQIAADARQRIESDGALKHDNSWGMRKMAFEINQRTEADYRFFRFETGGSLLDELNHNLRIADGVLRFRLFKVDPRNPVIVPPPPTPLSAGRPERGSRRDGPGRAATAATATARRRRRAVAAPVEPVDAAPAAPPPTPAPPAAGRPRPRPSPHPRPRRRPPRLPPRTRRAEAPAAPEAPSRRRGEPAPEPEAPAEEAAPEAPAAPDEE